MSQAPKTPWSGLDPAVKDPFDPRYVPKPTSPPPEWRKLIEYEAAATADPELALNQWFETTYRTDIHSAPFNHDAKESSPMHAHNNSLTTKSVVPRPSRHLIDAAQAHKRISDQSTAYGELVQGRPPSNVRPPFRIDISMLEICTFFPSWFQIPLVALRAIRNGFKREHIAKMQCNAVNVTDFNKVKTTSDRIQHHFSYGGKLHCGTPAATWKSGEYATREGLQHDLTADQWKLRCKYAGRKIATDMEWGDMLLTEIASSVPRGNFPAGDDRLLLTACLEYAVNHPELALDTSHWQWIINNCLEGFEVPPAPRGLKGNRDTVAHERLFPEEYEE